MATTQVADKFITFTEPADCEVERPLLVVAVRVGAGDVDD